MEGFHPIVQQWFASAFDGPTDVQKQAWPLIHGRQDTLIAAPTGAGKTLAAFLVALNDLFVHGLEHGLNDETTVVYVSPLKALSTDVNINLAVPRDGILAQAESADLHPPRIRTAVRTGDTTASQRAAMLRRPPHILVTTPESLYLLLTAERSRKMLRTVHTVIVDEIHAILPSRRGAHLALTLERLVHVAEHRIQRIGLSATQRPVERVAEFLTGRPDACDIVDLGHARRMDVALEVPPSPLGAVMAHEEWDEIYDRLADLARAHRTTLVFTSTRRLSERIARHVGERLGTDRVMAHHGSLAHARRREAEKRLKAGDLQVMVATASLELGIDIGSIDLVCQIGSPRSIATFLQRAGRSGHTISGTARARLFPTTRDDLLECTALLDAMRRSELEKVQVPDAPLDVLAQQLIAEAATEPWHTDSLYDLCRCAWPYRALDRPSFDNVVEMCARGFDTARGRRAGLLYYDAINRRVKGRPASRLVALTSGGAIPDSADYQVVLEPAGIPVGTVHEDFAIESFAGDIFQLGNTAWRILSTGSGVVRVEDAQGQPPTYPFWLGETHGRSDELSQAVSDLRTRASGFGADREAMEHWLRTEQHLGGSAAVQLAEYLCATHSALGGLPTRSQLVAERFFDDSGGMQLVIHAPFGVRLNRAWGLALRKRFCRTFNFELQAAATENSILLSLGPQHSFPLSDVFAFLQPRAARPTLTQAVLDSPMFLVRWRWIMNLSLAVPRARGGRKVPPPLQRMLAEDILVALFPDAAACLENIAGERDIPDHPLINQVIADCVQDAMDCNQLEHVLKALVNGSLAYRTVETAEPSPMAHEVLTASPHQFLDDAPLAERRSQAVHRRRAFDPGAGEHTGLLDEDALHTIIDQARPRVRNPDELHEALLAAGFLEPAPEHQGWFTELVHQGRAVRARLEQGGACLWIPTERIHEALAIWPLTLEPAASPQVPVPARKHALAAFVQCYLEIHGPVSTAGIASALHVDETIADEALLRLESAGVVMRGAYTAGAGDAPQWCHRQILARVYRATIAQRRRAIRPVTQADYMRFLLAWQRVAPEFRGSGRASLQAVLSQLSGFPIQAAAWEADVLPARVEGYEPEWLDLLCMSAQVEWHRATPSNRGSIRSSNIVFVTPETASLFGAPALTDSISAPARKVLEVLDQRGASFLATLETESGLLPTQAEDALGELVSRGLVTSDGFGGMRFLLTPVDRRRGDVRTVAVGRWSKVAGRVETSDESIERWGRLLLNRYGVVCRRVLKRENRAPPWRSLVRFYWTLEMRGEIQGGRFIDGVPGEHFALPEAVGLLRRVQSDESIAAGPVGLSAADPLNLSGIIGPGERIAAAASNRMVYLNGTVAASLIAGRVAGCTDGPDLRRTLLTHASARARAVQLGSNGN